MKHVIPIPLLRRRLRDAIYLLSTTITLCLTGTAAAAPGAHGPGGEHLDTPAHVAGSSSTPRLETSTELFELVARLHDGKLTILIDRFETNEPVLGALVEVDAGGVRAKATFHADLGDYAVDDPALLKALSAPGVHALVFTVVAGDESDLLEGTLTVAAPVHNEDDDHLHVPVAAWVGTGLLAIGAAGAWLWRRRARRSPLAAGIGGRS